LLRKYEGMFLFDPVALSDWEAVQAEVNRMLERAGARVIACGKWDERRLAFEIRGRKRGIYALTYFEAEASRIGEIERDVRLSESALRCLIVRVDHMTEDQMKESASKPASHAAPDDERGDRGDRYGDSRRPRRPEPDVAAPVPVVEPTEVEE
jgi:small subunit ribosomal protein S6